MNNDSVFNLNRVILCHFDTYSAASFYARYGSSILAPMPLPEDAAPIAAPTVISACYAADAVMQACITQYGYDPEQLTYATGFQAWMTSDEGIIRIHLLRFTTPDAPHATIAPHGAVFKPISEMRGTPMTELNLLRIAFDLVMSGG